MNILLLGGSPQVPSSSSRLLLHIGEQLALQGHRYSKLHVRDLPAKALLQTDHADPVIARALQAVADADAVVIATPIYKASYTGLLKAFLDLLPQDGLAGKLVLPLATGGSQSHMLALDYALRPVLQALAAKQVLTSIYATSQQVSWSEQQGLSLDAPIAARVHAGVEELASGLFLLQGLRAEPALALVAGIDGGAAPVRSLQDHPYSSSSQAA
ncbi:NADPH-dependent FMN reductase [Janthinobacterium agaricidamnosum]|uniref:NADH-dependent FMN reductase n=1 Tax=Janthinobacterium agaricidamnosum NBRC 102515 = DSM 9628 TaxID=1349767 RepID=W0V3L9_9BURK|nr:NADPH-dependent FMN reductase [Janthinobacterium agaricidamnosum]CDG82451.1 NADH-dependent FMN reductase [Janthinobacterium agaricidamnosum NBRC 102515 = DSM 9628]